MAEANSAKFTLCHIMTQLRTHFELVAVETIVEASKTIDMDNKFVVFRTEQYECFKDKIATEYSEGTVVEAINHYGKSCDYLFVHALHLRYWQLRQIEEEIVPKIFWVSWGSDLYGPTKPSLVDDFAGIGIAVKSDAIEVRRRYPTLPIYYLPYGYGVSMERRHLAEHFPLRDAFEGLEAGRAVQILIGHYGNSYEHHIQIMETLKKWRAENIKIVLFLAYGNEQYIAEVIKYAQDNFPGQVDIQTEMVPLLEWYRRINDIDVAIFDWTVHNGAGTLEALIRLHKKVFLHPYGVFKMACALEGVETFDTDRLADMSFAEFVKPLESFEAFDIYDRSACTSEKALAAYINTIKRLIYNKEKGISLVTKAIFYGAGGYAAQSLHFWLNQGYKPCCFVDADPAKQHRLFAGQYETLPLAAALEKHPNHKIFLSTHPNYYQEVTNLLRQAGISEGQIICLGDRP
jgi:hypothetical protein